MWLCGVAAGTVLSKILRRIKSKVSPGLQSLNSDKFMPDTRTGQVQFCILQMQMLLHFTHLVASSMWQRFSGKKKLRFFCFVLLDRFIILTPWVFVQ